MSEVLKSTGIAVNDCDWKCCLLFFGFVGLEGQFALELAFDCTTRAFWFAFAGLRGLNAIYEQESAFAQNVS